MKKMIYFDNLSSFISMITPALNTTLIRWSICKVYG